MTDAFGRTKQKSISLSPAAESNSKTPYSSNITTNYIYKNTNTTANSHIDTLLSEVKNGDTVTDNYGFSYDYDANGNITHEYSANADGTRGALRYRYTYDEANQLVRVDDNVQGKTYTYQYDKGGNRVSEKIYEYTLSEALGTVIKEVKSEYNYIVWNDRLSKYDGKTVTYDAVGNPTKYDGKTFEWEGKQLKSITAGDGSKTEYEYDSNGLRVMKKQYDEEGKLSYYVEYLWQDGKITTQYITLISYSIKNGVVTNTISIGPFSSKIFYDESGAPQGFSFLGETIFTFVRNLQGDVIAVVDSEGNTVMEYSYDPWGNLEYHLVNEELANNEETAMLFTALCPLTYRGYNYDFTTELYYLQSRYYNPEWGRFINCDDTNILLATQGETLGANMFAYCGNNPVNYVDPTGRDSSSSDLIQGSVSVIVSLILFYKMGYVDIFEGGQDAFFDYDIDSYNLTYFRIAYYMEKDKRYHIRKLIFGLTSSWSSYFNAEKTMLSVFRNSMSKAASDQANALMKPGSGQWSAGGVAIVLGVDMVLYFMGKRIIKGIYKGDYIEDTLKKANSKQIIAVSTKEEINILKSTAWIKVKTNVKPREKDIEMERIGIFDA